MKRLCAVILFLCLAVGIFWGLFLYAALREEQKRQEDRAAVIPQVTVYTDMPAGALQVFAEPYYAECGKRLVIQEYAKADILAAAEKGDVPDLYLLSQDALFVLKDKGKLSAYVSDKTDTVLNAYKDEEGYWTGVWMNPAVFAVNADFADRHPAFYYYWDEVLARQSVRLIVTDFIASDYSEDSLLSLVEHFGEEGAFDRLRMGMGHTVQYGKYLSTPAHMAAMDKCDIGISGYNEAMRVKKEDLPIRIIYPEDGTYFYLYGAAVAAEAKDAEGAEGLLDWLLSGTALPGRLAENGYDFIYVNDLRLPEDDLKQKLKLWELDKKYTESGKKALLDRWVHEIRFGERK